MMKALEKNTYKEQSERLNKAINDYTQLIANEYPELYQFLDESPLVMTINRESLSINELKEHLKSLKSQLEHYKLSHKKQI